MKLIITEHHWNQDCKKCTLQEPSGGKSFSSAEIKPWRVMPLQEPSPKACICSKSPVLEKAAPIEESSAVASHAIAKVKQRK